tara:strand:+ start:8637 stop:9125 length:489 start_codon:yes stop_codon:yes gene_type:complete
MALKNGQSEKAQLRRFRVLQSVLAGASERQIAEQEGVAYSLIHRDKKRILSDLAKEHVGLADDVRSIQMERYNQLMLRHWQRAMQGDVEATNLILRIMKEINVINGVIPDRPLISLSQHNLYMNDAPITFRIDSNDDTTEADNNLQETAPLPEANGGYILDQ